MKPGRLCALFAAMIFPAFFMFSPAFGANEQKTTAQTWRVYQASYNHVWNTLVKVVVQDWEYAVRAADPKEGYLGTWPKTKPRSASSPNDRRVSVNVNIKNAPEGVLVTASCLVEEFIPIQGSGKGRWMIIPSDNTCESSLLNAISRKLTVK